MPQPGMAQLPSWLTAVGRVLLSAHFLAELADKILRFNYWVGVLKDAGQPYPVAEMALVVLLLVVGAPLLFAGVRVPAACALLVIFQIPTTLLFETTWYERWDSISVIGGLCIAAALPQPVPPLAMPAWGAPVK